MLSVSGTNYLQKDAQYILSMQARDFNLQTFLDNVIPGPIL